MLTFRKRQGVGGAPETIQLKRRDETGGYTDLTNKYTGSEALLCVLWPGDDREVSADLPASWLDAPLGRVRVEFPLATMESLEVTWYSGMLKLADGSADLAAFRVVVESGPGEAAAPKTYHTYKDLTDELPFIGKVASYLEDQSGFAEVAAEARRWIDAAILRSAPDQDCVAWNGGIYGSLSQAENPIIAAALNAGQLIIATATGRRFVQASVYWSLAVILRRAVGMQTTNDLTELSRYYMTEANNKLMSCVAEIDVNADGKPEYAFALNRAKVRRA